MKIFTLESLRTGGVYRLKAEEVREFYDEHVLGLSRHSREQSNVARVIEFFQRKFGSAVFRDPFRVVGTVLVQLFGLHGELLDVRAGANLVVNVGKDAVIDRLQGTGSYSTSVFKYQGVGTGTNAAAAGDTALQTEIGTRQTGTQSQPASTTDEVQSTFAAGNATGAITETGRFDATTVGNLFARQVFSVINKGASDSLQVTHDITVS